MKVKILKSMFFTTVIVLIISFFMISCVLWEYYETQMFSELESEARYISYGIKNETEDFLKSIEKENKRITLISSSGTVISDTMADAKTLENHMDRKEVLDAINSGSGKSYRYSDTLLEKTLNYAMKLENGDILRVSVTQKSLIVVMLGMLQPILIIILAALIISFIFSYKLSNSIIEPINTIDLNAPTVTDTYDELMPFIDKISTQNITIKKQIEAARKSQEEFRLICENMNEGFLVVDKYSKVLSYNSAIRKFVHIDTSSKNIMLYDIKWKEFRGVIQKALKGSRAENTVELNDKTYNLIANPVCQTGDVIGAVIVIIDVTESAQREKLRKEFTSNVSHELKTPLTSISGFAEIMKSGDTSSETVVDFSTSIYNEAQRLITLVSDIMKISELDEGAVMLKKEKVDLYNIAYSVTKRLESVAHRQNIKLNIIGDSVNILGAEKILDEMIFNLLDNAIKYNKSGGVVDIIITASDEKVKLAVRDTGIGISNSEKDRVFERFYRVDKSRSKSAGGTGLGLAIVKHGAIYHDASVELFSEEGKGTCIIIEFKKI